MTTWFSSDHHFGHKSILKFCPETREGENTDEMDEILIDRHNQKVKPNHRVFFLGDLIFHTKPEKVNSILQRLNGVKTLIRGNHCYFPDDKRVDTSVFHEICHYKEIYIDKIKIVMFHFPMIEWNKMHYGSYHLFGHVHGNLEDTPFKTMDVGIDTRPGMSPYSWEEIHNKLKNRENKPHHKKAQP